MKRSQQLEATLSHKRLCELLHYDQQTGVFTWRKSNSNRKPTGSVAGCEHNGYVLLSIDGNLFYAHRVAWFYVTGAWPREVDHEDGDSTNNCWRNLREATHQQNGFNSKRRTDNKTGVKGIAFYPQNAKPYQAFLNGKYVGSFANLTEAEIARDALARASHGEFYREQ